MESWPKFHSFTHLFKDLLSYDSNWLLTHLFKESFILTEIDSSVIYLVNHWVMSWQWLLTHLFHESLTHIWDSLFTRLFNNNLRNHLIITKISSSVIYLCQKSTPHSFIHLLNYWFMAEIYFPLVSHWINESWQRFLRETPQSFIQQIMTKTDSLLIYSRNHWVMTEIHSSIVSSTSVGWQFGHPSWWTELWIEPPTFLLIF